MTVYDDLDKQVHGAGGPQPGRRLGEGRVELEAQALEGGWDGKTHRVRVGGSSVTEERLQGQDSARGGVGGPGGLAGRHWSVLPPWRGARGHGGTDVGPRGRRNQEFRVQKNSVSTLRTPT